MGTDLPFQLGITGGIGSGKSVFARLFSLMGIPVYESDTEARNLYSEPELREKVIALLGPEAYLSTGKPDTAAIAARIYAHPSLREKLNAILHPAVAMHYRNWLHRQRSPYVLKVAALLYEADIARQLDFTALVISPASLRKKRISLRDPHRPAEQTEAIMANQLSDEDKIKKADYLIYNDEQHSLIAQAAALHQKVLSLLKEQS